MSFSLLETEKLEQRKADEQKKADGSKVCELGEALPTLAEVVNDPNKLLQDKLQIISNGNYRKIEPDDHYYTVIKNNGLNMHCGQDYPENYNGSFYDAAMDITKDMLGSTEEKENVANKIVDNLKLNALSAICHAHKNHLILFYYKNEENIFKTINNMLPKFENLYQVKALAYIKEDLAKSLLFKTEISLKALELFAERHEDLKNIPQTDENFYMTVLIRDLVTRDLEALSKIDTEYKLEALNYVERPGSALLFSDSIKVKALKTFSTTVERLINKEEVLHLNNIKDEYQIEALKYVNSVVENGESIFKYIVNEDHVKYLKTIYEAGKNLLTFEDVICLAKINNEFQKEAIGYVSDLQEASMIKEEINLKALKALSVAGKAIDIFRILRFETELQIEAIKFTTAKGALRIKTADQLIHLKAIFEQNENQEVSYSDLRKQVLFKFIQLSSYEAIDAKKIDSQDNLPFSLVKNSDNSKDMTKASVEYDLRESLYISPLFTGLDSSSEGTKYLGGMISKINYAELPIGLVALSAATLINEDYACVQLISSIQSSTDGSKVYGTASDMLCSTSTNKIIDYIYNNDESYGKEALNAVYVCKDTDVGKNICMEIRNALCELFYVDCESTPIDEGYFIGSLGAVDTSLSG